MEYQLFMNRFNELSGMHSNKERTPAKHCEKNMWLIKPAALNQGKGIEVCRKLKDIVRSIRAKPLNSLWVIQKYIEKPLLFKGRKFDIRMWAIATGKHELFYYTQGYLRTSSSEYTAEATDNYIHLTNNCLQKYGENYGVHEKGNTLSFDEFQAYLDSDFPQYHLDFYQHFMPRMKDLMIDAYLSAKRIIHKSKRKTVFEFLGYDFLIDEDFRVWLIEVNTNPYLGVPNEYIENLLPQMLDDLLIITVDPSFPPRYPPEPRENNFKLLYAECGSAFAKEGLNLRQSYSTPFYPIPELAQVSLSKQCVPVKAEEEQIKVVTKDLLQTVKHILEDSLPQEVYEFTEVTSRVVGQISNWELLSEEQLSNSLQALKLISSSNGAAALLDLNCITIMLGIVESEHTAENMQIAVLEAVIFACHNMKFRKEVVKCGFISVLVKITLGNVGQALKDVGLVGLITLCNNPTKGVYVPGKSREHIWVKQQLISKGGIIALMKIARETEKDTEEKSEKVERIEKIMASEFFLPEWEKQVEVITKMISEESEILEIFGVETLKKIKEQLEEATCNRREEISAKKEREKIKKDEEDEERKQRAIFLKTQNDEKKQKAEEYINKRYEEIRKEKLNDLRKQSKYGRTIEDKLIEEKRHALLNKLKKAEEIKLIQEFKIKQQDLQLKRYEKLRKNKLSDRKRKFMSEYSNLRGDIEKVKMHKKSEDPMKLELDKVFNTLGISKKGYEKLESTDDSFFQPPDTYYSKLESSRFVGSIIVSNSDKKENARKFSPMISRNNLYKIYGKIFSNCQIGTLKGD